VKSIEAQFRREDEAHRKRLEEIQAYKEEQEERWTQEERVNMRNANQAQRVEAEARIAELVERKKALPLDSFHERERIDQELRGERRHSADASSNLEDLDKLEARLLEKSAEKRAAERAARKEKEAADSHAFFAYWEAARRKRER
jgi:hypothetical protein